MGVGYREAPQGRYFHKEGCFVDLDSILVITFSQYACYLQTTAGKVEMTKSFGQEVLNATLAYRGLV